jgi:hypothetical protein
VYDLSLDAISPVKCLSLLTSSIVGLSLVRCAHPTSGQRGPTALILAADGTLYSEPFHLPDLSASGDASDPYHIVASALSLPMAVQGLKGAGVHYSASQRLLIVSYETGLTLFARLSSALDKVLEASTLMPPPSGGRDAPKGPCQWIDLACAPLTAGVVMTLADITSFGNAASIHADSAIPARKELFPAAAKVGGSSGGGPGALPRTQLKSRAASFAGAGNSAETNAFACAALLCVPHSSASHAFAVCLSRRAVLAQPLGLASTGTLASASTATGAGASRSERGDRSSSERAAAAVARTIPLRSATSVGAAVQGCVSFICNAKEPPVLMLLHADGSMQVYACPLAGSGSGGATGGGTSVGEPKGGAVSGAASGRGGGRGSSVTGQGAVATRAGWLQMGEGGEARAEEVKFPVDFFEWCSAVTPEVKLSGDFLRNTEPEAAKLALTAEDGCVADPLSLLTFDFRLPLAYTCMYRRIAARTAYCKQQEGDSSR